MTLTGSSLARHVAFLDQCVGLDGQSCSSLIVGWPVGSFISNPWCWTVDRLYSCLIVGRLVDHMFRTVRRCYNGGGGYGGDKGGNSCRCRSSYADATLSKVHG